MKCCTTILLKSAGALFGCVIILAGPAEAAGQGRKWIKTGTDPNSALIRQYHQAGLVLLSLGFDAAAEQIGRAGAELSKFDKGNRRVLCEALINQGKYQEALIWLNEMNKDYDEWAYPRIGLMLLRTGNVNGSAKMWDPTYFTRYMGWDGAAKWVPVPSDARSLEGAWLFLMGFNDDKGFGSATALRWYRQAHAYFPESPLLGLYLGRAEAKVPNLGVAFEHLERSYAAADGRLKQLIASDLVLTRQRLQTKLARERGG